MSYTTGENALFTRIKACTGFDATNTFQADWKCLNGGKSDHYAILKAGEATFDWQELSGYIVHYQTQIEVWQQYTSETATAPALYGYVSNIRAILAYPHLNGIAGVQDMNISGISAVEEMWRSEGGPAWLRQIISVVWDMEYLVTFSE